MDGIFSVDGVSYAVAVEKISRKARLVDGVSAGTMLSGRNQRDMLGTFYDYSISIDTELLSLADYDALYEVLTEPVDYHVVEVPYGQGTLVFSASIYETADELLLMDGENIWGELTVNFVAQEPKRVPR